MYVFIDDTSYAELDTGYKTAFTKVYIMKYSKFIIIHMAH